ncbi:uncharacterized protein LOC5516516 isoform X2 [Nematostella vectensis]|uniref:uncharacterized protein LOC5516516 isoform X2 n=1 Tax=Nematostella vectensis TaxID=45351 RepID=UPI0020774AC4|nr:uncharacterized protein LOC5516516 isoform X2 [Nematostella vectensis]
MSSIHISQFDTKAVGYNTRSTKQARSKTETRLEVRETRVQTTAGIDIQPSDSRSSTQTTTHGKSIHKGLKISKPRSHVASSWCSEEPSNNNITTEHVSTAIHYIGGPKNIKPSQKNVVSCNTQAKSVRPWCRSSLMMESERGTLAGSNHIPGIPKLAANEQSTQRVERTIYNTTPVASITSFQQNFTKASSSAKNVRSVVTDFKSTSSKPSSEETTGKQTDELRVIGQSGLNPWNVSPASATADCFPSKADRSNPYGKLRSRNEKQRSDFHQVGVDQSQMDGLVGRSARSRAQQSENTNTDVGESSAALYDYESQEQCTRHTNYKHYSSTCRSGPPSTYTESASDGFSSSQSDASMSSSADLSRTNTSSSKRRKRVKRKVSGKSIGARERDDNTSEGESDTLRRHDRRFRKRDDEGIQALAAKSSEQSAKGQTYVLGSTTTGAKAGSQFRSSSLTSVSSTEGNKGSSRTQSPSLTPRGATLAKKIQIQSFSAVYTSFNKDNKENQPRRRASTEERTRDRIMERSINSDNTGSGASLDKEHGSERGSSVPSKGRPFTLRNKRFRMKRSSSKDTSSPYTSDADSTASTPQYRCAEDRYSSDQDITHFTDQQASRTSISPIPTIPPATNISSSSADSSFQTHAVGSLEDEVFSTRTYGMGREAMESSFMKGEEGLGGRDTGHATLGEPTPTVVIPGSASEQSDDDDVWVSQSYPPRRAYPEPPQSLTSPYSFNRPLSIVNEQEEMENTLYSNSEGGETSNKRNGFQARKTSKEGRKDTGAEVSPLRRASYVRAQQNVGDFALFRSFDDDSQYEPIMMPDLDSDNHSHKSKSSSKHSKKNRKSKEGSLDNFISPKEIVKSYSNSDQENSLELLEEQEGDLISFDDGNGDSPCESKGVDGSGEPVKKRKKKISRPKIPTIFYADETKSTEEEEEGNDDIDDDDVSEGMVVQKAREETMGQDSMDEKCIGGSTEEDLDMIENSSKRNTLVAIESDDESSTPKIGCSPVPDVTDEERMTLIADEGLTKSRSARLSPYPTPPQITTDLYIEDNDEDDSSLKKVETIYDLCEEEKDGISYIDDEHGLYQDVKSVESYGTQSDTIESPEPKHVHDKYSLSTSGFSEAIGELSDSEEIPTDNNLLIGNGKSSSDDGWRSQSDPSGGGRTNGAGAPLCETIAEAAELNNYRNSNSAPNLITEKVMKESAQLAKRVSKNHLDVRPTVSRTKSTPSAFLMPSVERMELVRRKSEGSMDDFHIEGSMDDDFESSEEYAKNIRAVKSAPTTPTAPRKQIYQNQFSAEKTQMKLAKLAAMEPIYETPPTETVKPIPLPEPVKLERKSGLIPATDETRPPVTGTSTKSKAKQSEIKRHVLQNLLDTEQSYVQNLQYLVTNYLKPLKRPENANIVEPAQVDEMFYQIPDILLCHEFFLDQLQARVNDWHDKQKIGDIIVASFTKCFLMDAYSAFINHFLHARAAVRVATMSRPGFARFIEQCCRDHREKLTLQDLMIMPVQRIPRYVLILKDMIKHTPTDHPDHGSLQLAMGEIKTLANRMNMREKEVNKAEKDAEDLRAIEASIEGISDLVIPGRYFKRKDLAAEVRGSITKKDRSLFLFNDLLVCAIVKRKPNALRRGSLSLFSGQSGAGAEFNKHKLLWKLPLEYIELLRSSPEVQRRNSLERELERLDNDMSLLSQISALSDTLNISHQMLDSSIRELMNDVSRQIAERQVPVQQSLSAKLELQAQTEEGPETFTFLLLDAEIKNSWESDFMNARKELAHAKDTFPPEFQQPIPITKTRSGMQFTCSSPSLVPHMLDRGNHCGSGDVWVCNSDGYVGQVCILSMGENIQPIASLSVCSSRILCISPVPGARLIGLETIHPDADSKSDTRSLGESSSYKVPSTKSTDYEDEDDVRSAQTIIAFDSSSEDEDGLGNDSFMEGKFGSGSPMFDGRLSPEGSSLGTIDGEMESSDDDESVSDENASSDDDDKRKHGRKHIGKSRNLDSGTVPVPGAEDKLSDIVPFEAEEGSTVWLGTEDGSIYVYPIQDIQQITALFVVHYSLVYTSTQYRTFSK